MIRFTSVVGTFETCPDVGEVFREAGALAESKRTDIESALAAAINGQKKAADGVVMDSSSWVISAINPQ